MYELKKNGKVFTSKSVGTGPLSCEKIIYRAAVSQRLRIAALLSILVVSAVLKIFRLVKVTLWDWLVSPFTRGTGCPAVVFRLLAPPLLCQLPVSRC